MIVDRVFTPGLAQVAYLVADEEAGVAVVIDPRRDIEAYLDWAASHNLRIISILETHVHADFVSGARELRDATGAPVFASSLGNQTFPIRPVNDGDKIPVGSLTLRAFWTPGHTPEHMSYLLFDPSIRTEPLAFFSGDLLFAGEVGRPDLLGAEHTLHLARQLYETLSWRLRDLPDDVTVYPGHTAGSSCGKNIGDAPQTTLGQERRFNYALQARALSSQDAFIDAVMTEMPAAPTYYPKMKQVNRVGPSLLRDLPSGGPLPPEEVEQKVKAGALIIDARSTEEFAQAHIAGSFFAGADPDFVNWVGWLAPYDRELILVLNDDAQYHGARTQLRRIGLDAVAGYLLGGVVAWQKSGRPVVSFPTMTVEALRARLTQPDELVVLDVRTVEEWKHGHIPGAIHQFAGEIAKGAELPASGAKEIAVTCASGYRSTVALSLLEARGRHNLINVTGGMDAWQAAHLPMEAA